MELLMVIAVMTIIMGISFYFFSSLSKKEALEKNVDSLVSLIRNGRMLSIESKDAMPFGIHLEAGKAVLFEGNTYASGGANEKIFEFSNGVYLSGYSLDSGDSDIVFDRLTGGTSDFGTVTLSSKGNSTSTVITILKTGVIQ